MTKEGVQFSTKGDIGTANIICRKNTVVDKKEKATIIEMDEPISLTFALRYLNAFTKATLLWNETLGEQKNQRESKPDTIFYVVRPIMPTSTELQRFYYIGEYYKVLHV